ncbi:DMT family transporter [Reyranella sp. CPCC 100927]|uniref:DMT family transporter n=1 Tax=Reyranella sp. CPCC 100927 TaxID=2599616 RepID=UPI0011B694B9|nr:DMT family transporter [Reyranella sp. CPCC 100927]TWT11801.1 DMT family transporter [Reyranella sp. CPCC 100927]
MENLLIPASLVAGALLAVQAGANAQLSKAVGSPFGATAIQLSVGTIALAVIAALTCTLGTLLALGDARWWHVLGGTASAFYVVSTILLFPRLGAVVSVGLFIAGQMLASLALDHFGLLGVPIAPLGTSMMIGGLAVLGGAAAIVLGQQGAASTLSASKLGWVALALAAGAVLPVQGAVNALLRAQIGAPFAVGTVSFLVAALSMIVVLLLAMAVLKAPAPGLGGIVRMPWWGWLGGFAGAIYVTTVFVGMPVIGASAVVGFTVAGQQAASVLVDRYGWFRLPRRPASSLRLAGVIALLAGVAVIKGF